MHKQSEDSIWTEHLRKKICIVDTDTRSMNEYGQLLNRSHTGSRDMDHHAAAMLSHYLYAKFHGYDSQMLRSPQWKNRANSWVRVLLTREA